MLLFPKQETQRWQKEEKAKVTGKQLDWGRNRFGFVTDPIWCIYCHRHSQSLQSHEEKQLWWQLIGSIPRAMAVYLWLVPSSQCSWQCSLGQHFPQVSKGIVFNISIGRQGLFLWARMIGLRDTSMSSSFNRIHSTISIGTKWRRSSTAWRLNWY